MHLLIRCGFAATATTNRVQAGASYYGVLDMTGNVAEQCIGGYSYNYSTFTNVCGDGSLSTVGNANVATWPSPGGGQGGAIIRGGDWYSSASYLAVSIRSQITNSSNTNRYPLNGGRGVR